MDSILALVLALLLAIAAGAVVLGTRRTGPNARITIMLGETVLSSTTRRLSRDKRQAREIGSHLAGNAVHSHHLTPVPNQGIAITELPKPQKGWEVSRNVYCPNGPQAMLRIVIAFR